MLAYDAVLEDMPPELVIVVGDVNSTVACTLTAVKRGIPVAHLEAGLRSFDRSMPEEINRIVTDSIAHLLWTPSADGDENLLREGVPAARIERVGNVMIDSLELIRSKVSANQFWRTFNLREKSYGVATFHRPGNVDSNESLTLLVDALMQSAELLPLVLPLHPRTRSRLQSFGLYDALASQRNLIITEPLSYRDFISLVFASRLVVTDSGGLQEETTYLGIPCLTVRPNTERPITITHGTNRLCSLESLALDIRHRLEEAPREPPRIPLWDGQTASRVVDSVRRFLHVPLQLEKTTIHPESASTPLDATFTPPGPERPRHQRIDR